MERNERAKLTTDLENTVTRHKNFDKMEDRKSRAHTLTVCCVCSNTIKYEVRVMFSTREVHDLAGDVSQLETLKLDEEAFTKVYDELKLTRGMIMTRQTTMIPPLRCVPSEPAVEPANTALEYGRWHHL
jgi:hypothetical protein